MRLVVGLGGVNGTDKTANQWGVVVEFAPCWYAIRPEEGSGLQLAKFEWRSSDGAFPSEENENFLSSCQSTNYASPMTEPRPGLQMACTPKWSAQRHHACQRHIVVNHGWMWKASKRASFCQNNRAACPSPIED
jgi:hypothetical protein